jgi:hypothetical protein
LSHTIILYTHTGIQSLALALAVMEMTVLVPVIQFYSIVSGTMELKTSLMMMVILLDV